MDRFGGYGVSQSQHDPHNHGYTHPTMDDNNFGAKAGSIVSAFDAFPKSKPQYVHQTSTGGKWTVLMILIAWYLVWQEAVAWWRGTYLHVFAVERGVSRSMQLNLDVVVPMRCVDLHVNVQDAAGDRILAASVFKMDPTVWEAWVDAKGVHRLGRDRHGRVDSGEGWMDEEGFGKEHVHDIVAAAVRRPARFAKTPRLRKGVEPSACRIFGSMDLNKVQGDLHVTARGHGYEDWVGHLDHSSFNFSHIVNELSFGPFFPSLENPLDGTVNIASGNFHKFQYFTSVVPTVYSVGHVGRWRSGPDGSQELVSASGGGNTIVTNQYAVAEQSKPVSDHEVPGIFIKYDIEPIMLTVEEVRPSYLALMMKMVNIVSGVLVTGHWCFTMSEWAREVLGRRVRRSQGLGVLGVEKPGYSD